MNIIKITGDLVYGFLRLINPKLHIEVLTAKHAAAAAELLSREFCRREPLCRALGMEVAEIRPTFSQLVAHVAEQKLGVVAVNREGEVLGVITVEDHCNLYTPTGSVGSEGLMAINQFLDETKLPRELAPTKPGVAFYCAVAAASGEGRKVRLLSLMVLGLYRHVRRLGYRQGYAKVTNPAVIKRIGELERLAVKEVFRTFPGSIPAAFQYEGRYPFARYTRPTTLLTWKIY